MEFQLSRVIDQVSREKQIEREVIVGAIEEAMVQAAHRLLGALHSRGRS